METIKKVVGIIGIIAGVTVVVSTVASWIVSIGYLIRYGRTIDKAMNYTEKQFDDLED